jgi:PPM family protein phosphatase
MSAWRELLTRFRKDLPQQSDLAVDPAVVTSPATIAIVPPSMNVEADRTKLDPASDPEDGATRTFGDTTASLVAAPQLAALHGERVLHAAALRDLGRERSENQDHCFAQVIALPTDDANTAIGLFIVADGMGGHHDGGRASHLALSTVVKEVLGEFIAPTLLGTALAPQPILQAAVQAANAAVYGAGQAAGNDMGTTCTAALLHRDEIIVAHVGDSRALLIGGGCRQLTTDHTAVGRLIAIGALTPEEAWDHPLRNQLYRSIGQQADVPVEITTTRLHGETHLVLCSDGLWGLVPEAEIVDIVAEAPTPHIAARHLIARANLLGGHDNISVVVVALPGSAGGAA